ncbi:hypothetical protein EDB85DRAFT_543260 [Lactarius pseudohatsudake]|nr:hypothetical protein EDB85DRAFT_543260 [Lactarius pseudohatsudake]
MYPSYYGRSVGYPEDQRVTLKQNPHFYLSRDLSDRPDNYDDKFVLKPLKDLKPEKDLVVLILSDRNGQIYFDYEKFSKTYGNIWKPHDAIILKDLQGTLEAANRISPKINGEVCIWQRGGDRPDEDLTEWTEVLSQALSAPDADWLIRSGTSPDEAFDIEVTGGWERCSPIKEPEPAPVFGQGNSVSPASSREDVFTPLEDALSLDSGFVSDLPTLDSSGESSYYSRDDTGLSDDTINTSVEEVQNVEEYSPPVEDAVFSGPEVSFPLDGGVQVDTAIPSPVSTPHALPELLDPPIGSEPDAASSVFVPDRIITPKRTHLLVETVHVPPQPTLPSPEPPTPPISNDEATANDNEPILDSATPLSENTHFQLQLAHSSAPTPPSPTPPPHATDAPNPDIVTPLEHAPRQVEVVHLLVQPVLSPPRPLTPPTESKMVPKSDVAASHELTPASKFAHQQDEVVRPPVQLVRDPEPQVPALPVIEPAPASNVAVSSTLRLEHARPRIEPVHSPNPPTRTPEVPTPPLCSIPATANNAPAPVMVVAVSESARPRVEAVHRPVQLVPAPQPLPPPAASRPTPAPGRVATVLESTPPRVEMVHRPAQLVPAPPSLPPPAESKPTPAPDRVATVPESTRPRVEMVHRPVQLLLSRKVLVPGSKWFTVQSNSSLLLSLFRRLREISQHRLPIGLLLSRKVLVPGSKWPTVQFNSSLLLSLFRRLWAVSQHLRPTGLLLSRKVLVPGSKWFIVRSNSSLFLSLFRRLREVRQHLHLTELLLSRKVLVAGPKQFTVRSNSSLLLNLFRRLREAS